MTDRKKVNSKNEIADDIIKTLEEQTGQKIFTLRVLDHQQETETDLPILVVFEDKSILRGEIIIQKTGKKEMAARVRGSYI